MTFPLCWALEISYALDCVLMLIVDVHLGMQSGSGERNKCIVAISPATTWMRNRGGTTHTVASNPHKSAHLV